MMQVAEYLNLIAAIVLERRNVKVFRKCDQSLMVISFMIVLLVRKTK